MTTTPLIYCATTGELLRRSDVVLDEDMRTPGGRLMSDSDGVMRCGAENRLLGWSCDLLPGHRCDHISHMGHEGCTLSWGDGDSVYPGSATADADDCPARCPARYSNELGDVQCQKVEGHDGLHEYERLSDSDGSVGVRRWGDEECVDDGGASSESLAAPPAVEPAVEKWGCAVNTRWEYDTDVCANPDDVYHAVAEHSETDWDLYAVVKTRRECDTEDIAVLVWKRRLVE